jgi:hypothetical protein
MLKGPAVVPTGVVVIVKFAEVEPEEIVTFTGTAAEVSSLDRVTRAPAPGALPLRVTVPLEVLPPSTPAGLTVKEESTAGLTVSPAVEVDPP